MTIGPSTAANVRLTALVGTMRGAAVGVMVAAGVSVTVAETLAVALRLRVAETRGVGVSVETLRVWFGALVGVTVKTLRVWVGNKLGVSVETLNVWLGCGVTLGISLGVGVNDANEAVSSANAVCTPACPGTVGVGVAVSGAGVGGGAAQAAATARARIVEQRPARRGRHTRAL